MSGETDAQSTYPRLDQSWNTEHNERRVDSYVDGETDGTHLPDYGEATRRQESQNLGNQTRDRLPRRAVSMESLISQYSDSSVAVKAEIMHNELTESLRREKQLKEIMNEREQELKKLKEAKPWIKHTAKLKEKIERVLRGKPEEINLQTEDGDLEEVKDIAEQIHVLQERVKTLEDEKKNLEELRMENPLTPGSSKGETKNSDEEDIDLEVGKARKGIEVETIEIEDEDANPVVPTMPMLPDSIEPVEGGSEGLEGDERPKSHSALKNLSEGSEKRNIGGKLIDDI